MRMHPLFEISSISELPGKKVGMVNGTIFDILLANNVDGISQDDIMCYDSNAEVVGALVTGKVDAMTTDLHIAQLAVSKQSGIGIVPGSVVEACIVIRLEINAAAIG